jgi:hypothetical protein
MKKVAEFIGYFSVLAGIPLLIATAYQQPEWIFFAPFVRLFSLEILVVFVLLLVFQFRRGLAALLKTDGIPTGRILLGLVGYVADAFSGEANERDRRWGRSLAISTALMATTIVVYSATVPNTVVRNLREAARQDLVRKAIAAELQDRHALALQSYQEILTQYPGDARNRVIERSIDKIAALQTIVADLVQSLDDERSDEPSLRRFDLTLTICSLDINALDCRGTLSATVASVEGVLASLKSSSSEDCASTVGRLRQDHRYILFDPSEQKWFGAEGEKFASVFCMATANQSDADVVKYVNERWRLQEVKAWLANPSADNFPAGS